MRETLHGQDGFQSGPEGDRDRATGLVKGDRIEYLIDHLGTLKRPQSRMGDEIVMAGHEGTYLEPATWITEDDDWHITSTHVLDADGFDVMRFVPVHRSQFRVLI